MPEYYRTQGTLADFLSDIPWPVDFFEPEDLDGFLARIHVLDHDMIQSEGELRARVWLAIEGELALGISGLDGVQLVAGSNAPGYTFLKTRLRIGDDSEFALYGIKLAVRFDRDLLKPANEDGTPSAIGNAEIRIEGSVRVSDDFDFDFDGFDAIDLAPVMIGDTGIAISAKGIKLDLSRTRSPSEVLAAGFDESFLGVYIGEAKVQLPEGLPALAPEDLVLRNCAIGSGGVSGLLEAHYDPVYNATTKAFTGSGAGNLFGIPFGLQDVEIEFKRNALVKSSMRGQMLLPFFEYVIDVEIALDLGGGFSVKLTNAVGGLLEIKKDDVLEFVVDGIGFEVVDGVFKMKMGGTLTPLIQADDIDWPTFEVKELTIDSNGNVELEGGWIDLPDQCPLDLFNFPIDLTKFGLGQEGGEKFLAFSGELRLPGGLSGGASVEGLRIYWDDQLNTRLTLEGVGVELEIPNVLEFSGAVSFRDLGTEKRFDGGIKLDLISLGIVVDGVLVLGSTDVNGRTERFMAVYLEADYPAGLPLFGTGVSIYAFAGLFALQYQPDKTGTELWYSVDQSQSWFHKPDVGTADLTKWDFGLGTRAFGAGVTIGTTSDSGFTFSGRVLLILVFPGPVLLLEGAANLLKKRSQLEDEPQFHALAVLDVPAGEFLVGLDARYRFGKKGGLIDIGGSVEAFFSLADPKAWHLYIGKKTPTAARVRARILRIFQANAYFMLDANLAQTGAWIGWGKSWKFGPVNVVAEAWLEGGVVISWRPAHYSGGVWLHGRAELTVFGKGLGLTIDALVAAEVFDPYHLLAAIAVKIKVLFKNIEFTIKLEWGPEAGWPTLTLPLEEVAIEHFKAGQGWPLKRGTALLVPDYSQPGGVLFEGTVTHDPTEPPPANAPVVPLDARPRLTFARQVHDDAKVAVNVQPVKPTVEVIGDPSGPTGPATIRYGVTEVALHRWDPASETWVTVARAREGETAQQLPAGITRLYGSWAAVPALAGGADKAAAQTKLWLWSKNAFDHSSRSGGNVNESWLALLPDYPCVELGPASQVCFDFLAFVVGDEVSSPLVHPSNAEVVFEWPGGGPQTISVMPDQMPGIEAPCLLVVFVADGPLIGGRSASELGVPPGADYLLTVSLPAGSSSGVTLTVSSGDPVYVLVLTASNAVAGPFTNGPAPATNVTIDVPNVRKLFLYGSRELCLQQVCINSGATAEQQAEADEIHEHLLASLSSWSDAGHVLEPHRDYRVMVETTVEASGGELSPTSKSFTLAEYAFFRTEGPPGIANLSLLPGASADPNTTLLSPSGGLITVNGSSSPTPVLDTPLNGLTLYVEQTLPPTVPAPQEKAPLPRPVYRAYDVRVVFNEDYVSLMYRASVRDLVLQLYDNNDRPLRDAAGNVVVDEGSFDLSATPLVDETVDWWVSAVNAASCVPQQIDPPLPEAAGIGGQVLDPDAVHEARLVPLILHETLASYDVGATAFGQPGSGQSDRLGLWTAVDEAAGPSSAWQVVESGSPPTRSIVQSVDVAGGSSAGNDPVKPGALLLRGADPALPAAHPDQPPNWTDYRVRVLVGSTDDDAVGVVFRYRDAQNFYRFSMDRERGYRRLVRVSSGDHTILAEDEFRYAVGFVYRLTIEAIGAELRVAQDGEPLFSVSDPAHSHGTFGLYTWSNAGASFADVRVDDFRATAPVVYRFKFTTSQVANFHHQVHRFRDEVWRVDSPTFDQTLFDPAVALPAAPGPPDAAEARAYEELAAATPELERASRRAPPVPEVQRLEVEESPAVFTPKAFLLTGPEPIDWRRTTLEVLVAPEDDAVGSPPAAVKLTAAVAGLLPSDESVTLLLDGARSLRGHRVERRRFAQPFAAGVEGGHLLADAFRVPAGRLFTEGFGPNALDKYELVHEGTSGTAAWSSTGTAIVQTGDIGDGSLGPDLHKPGTMALTGDATWRDVVVRVRLSTSVATGEIGVVVRYQDADNYLRFSVNRQFGYRRLVKREDGVTTLLWEGPGSYVTGVAQRLRLTLRGDRIYGVLDDTLLFDVPGAAPVAGRVGCYCWSNTGASFDEVLVDSLDFDPLRWRPSLDELDSFAVFDAPGATNGPSQWSAVAGVLSQTSNISGSGIPEFLGTNLVTGFDWDDFELSAEIASSDNGALGLLFRYQDEDNYYRFSMDNELGVRGLVKRVHGVSTVLDFDTVSYTVGQSYAVTIVAVGDRISVRLDGDEILGATDGDLASGAPGFYTRKTAGATFRRVVVLDPTIRVETWQIVDSGTTDGPSVWSAGDGALLQRTAISDQGSGNPPIQKAGTMAVAGEADWTDIRAVATLRSEDLGTGVEGAIGLAVRYAGEGDYYRLSLDAEEGLARLVKAVDGAFTTLWEDSGFTASGVNQELVLDATADRLTGFLDGERLFQIVDATHATGRVGLYAWKNAGAVFDAVEVRNVPLEARALFRDAFHAGDASAWTIADMGSGPPSVWNAVGGFYTQTSNHGSPPPAVDGTYAWAGDQTWNDIVLGVRLRSESDGAIGAFVRWAGPFDHYFFLMSRVMGVRVFGKRVAGIPTILWIDSFAYERGRTYDVVIAAEGERLRVFQDGVQVVDLEDGSHPQGAIGLLCWRNPAAFFSQVRVYDPSVLEAPNLMAEEFDFEIPGLFEVVDEGTVSAPSEWQVAGGELQQTSDIQGVGNEPEAEPGTTAVFGSQDWTDVRVVTRLRTETAGEWIGVAFRHLDIDHYYRFSMSPAGGRRLVKKVAGAVTTLWEDLGSGYQVGTRYVLTVECVGERIRVHLDGVLLTEVLDADLTAGRVGLYCQANPGARFAALEVHAPVWRTHHVFGEEPVLPAGTRVRVHSGSAALAPAPEVGAEDRFVAAVDEDGTVQLPEDALDLRLVDQPGNVLHGRRVLRSAAYAPVGFEILRKADGTAAFLVPQSGTLAAGSYRLAFRYRRDAGAGLPVQSQAGDTSDEVATIDLPWRPANPRAT